MSTKSNITQHVLTKIRTGEVSMRPKIYFVGQVVLIVALSLVALALVLFVLSFIIFSIHESGEQFLLGFGRRGFLTLITLFPWVPLALAIGFLVLLEYLLRTFTFGYRLPMLRVFLVLILVAIFGGAAVSLTPLHATLLNQADQDALPFIGIMYEAIHDSHESQGVFRGRVESIASDSFMVGHDDRDRDRDDGDYRVIPPEEFDLKTLFVGERVFVAGQFQGETLHAYGVEPYDRR